ncbi:MAG: hypothetical protein B6U72_06340 [Candidatus Altiarchaeales archaeon ex4484_2]|nr:MAG: hypothetical protein B6U72_06340 [Candidatus Altiarchaeales archaeon ex4484_2]
MKKQLPLLVIFLAATSVMCIQEITQDTTTSTTETPSTTSTSTTRMTTSTTEIDISSLFDNPGDIDPPQPPS